MPALRLVLGSDRVADDNPALPMGNRPTSEAQAGWADEPLSLLALAVALEHLVGEAPDPYLGPSPELEAWFTRYGRAADILVEVANGDARALRRLFGPVLDDGEEREPGRGLIISAAVRVERGRRPR